jgi:hypothetical protein
MSVMVAVADPGVSVSDTLAAERLRPPITVSEADFMVHETECAP